MTVRVLKRTIAWLLLAVTLIFLLTGFGITEYGLVTLATGGILNKANATLLHSLLWGPFVILLIVHIAFSRSALKK